MNTNQNLRPVALNDEQTCCDLCGKMELRGTVVVADADNNEVGRYGTTCASKVLGEKFTRPQVKAIEAARRQAVVHLLLTARDNEAQRAYCLGQLDRYFILVHADEQRLYNSLARVAA